jgi:hypothetical protein
MQYRPEGDSKLLAFRKGEKILIDRSVKSNSSYSSDLIFGRIGQREGFFPNQEHLISIEEYLI